MNKLAVVSSTRADFGLLCPVIKELRKKEEADFCVELIVTGTHLDTSFGYTVNEIRDSMVRIDKELVIPVASDTALDTCNNQAIALQAFAQLFSDNKYQAVLLLGDRYEILAAAIAAATMNIPIIHMCGGDVTEGAIDEWIRHSITKMSWLHFPTNEDSRKRIIQLGENPSLVFDFGFTAIDNALSLPRRKAVDILAELGIPIGPYILCTYHPVTKEGENGEIITQHLDSLSCAIKAFGDIHFIVTKANSDCGGSLINTYLELLQASVTNVTVVSSLGMVRYLSLMREAICVLGNSSSGILETPMFGIPSVNIGDRQKGRLQAGNVINCGEDSAEIIQGIRKALSKDFREACRRIKNPYGDGTAAKRIADKIYQEMKLGHLDAKKHFFDVREV